MNKNLFNLFAKNNHHAKSLNFFCKLIYQYIPPTLERYTRFSKRLCFLLIVENVGKEEENNRLCGTSSKEWSGETQDKKKYIER